MDIDLDGDDFVEGLEELLDDLDATTRQAMDTALDIVAAKARELAPKGPTSMLANSIAKGPITGTFSAGTLEGTVFAGAPYAAAVEDGTRPHVIEAKHRRALRIPIEGGFLFRRRVNHPGTQAQPFLGPALEQSADDIEGEFTAAVELALLRSKL